MLLLTVQEWRGPNGRTDTARASRIEPAIHTIGFVSRMPLSDAVNRLHRYEEVFNTRFSSIAVTLRVIGVAVIEDLSEDIVQKAGMEMIDTLPQRVDQF